MGRHPLEPARKPPFPLRGVVALAVASVALLLLGFAVREAEFNQVGSSNAASMWVFVASGLCLYALIFLVWTARRGRRRAK